MLNEGDYDFICVCFFIYLFVCLSVCSLDYSKSYEQILMIFLEGGGGGRGPKD